MHLTSLALAAASIAHHATAKPLQPNATTTATLVARDPRDEDWIFAYNFEAAKGSPYFEWWHTQQEMLDSPAYEYAFNTHGGQLSIVIENRDTAPMGINPLNKDLFVMNGGAYAIVGNIPPGGSRTLRAFPGCSNNNINTCLGYPGLATALEWSNEKNEDGYINLSASKSPSTQYFSTILTKN
jgi:hypothetical protein